MPQSLHFVVSEKSHFIVHRPHLLFLKKSMLSFRKSSLAVLISSLFLSAPSITAAAEVEKNAKAVDETRVVITGSRLKRIDMEGAAPVTTITALDLQKAGFATVGDALRSSNLNSFGSYGGGSNNSWGSQSTVQLKGASASHTLVLLDGKRMAKSPVLNGGAANINTIPTAAIERIEILTDGASAVYGTDAIAGVINVILKKDFDGIEFSGRMDSPVHKGGDSSNVSFTGGLDSNRGNLVFTFEHYEKEVIMNADRWYTKAFVKDGEDPKAFQNWVNLSPTGRVLTQGSAGNNRWEHPFVGDDCAGLYGANFLGVLNDLDYPGDTLCGYNYAVDAATTNSQTRDNTLVVYNYSINDNLELTARAYWAKNKTQDISAPVPASIKIPGGLPGYTTAAGHQLVPLLADPAAGMQYRFDTAGQRVAEHHDTVSDFLLSLQGMQEHFEWDWSVSFSNYTNFTWGTGYLLDGAQNDLVGSWSTAENKFIGWDPRDPNSALPSGAKANYDKRKRGTNMETNGGLSLELMELEGGTAGLYVGFAYREETFDSQVDALADAGLIRGGNGGSGGAAERDVSAFYFEMALPMLDSLEMNLAARSDQYSDFGSTVNPQLSIRYNPVDALLLRTSWGTGFRAPTLSDLYRGTATGFNRTTNYIRCYEKGEDIDSCSRNETVANKSSGNIALGPEESDSFNVGAVWEVTDALSFTMDYWILDTEGLIEEIDHSEVMKTQAKLYQAADAAGVARPSVATVYPGAEISMLSNGRIDSVTSPVVNIGLTEREGIDFKMNGLVGAGEGDIKYGLAITHYLKYKYTYVDGGISTISEDQAGREDTPDLRLNLTLDYSLADHTFSYYGNLIGSQESFDYIDEAKTQLHEIGSVIYHNLTYTYQTPWSSSFTLGVVNVTDEDPRFELDGTYEADLYGVTGRTYYLQYVQAL